MARCATGTSLRPLTPTFVDISTPTRTFHASLDRAEALAQPPVHRPQPRLQLDLRRIGNCRIIPTRPICVDVALLFPDPSRHLAYLDPHVASQMLLLIGEKGCGRWGNRREG